MQEKHLFEYAVLRVVPRVEREEFINAGVILYCRDLKFLDMKYEWRTDKLDLLNPDIDTAEVKEHLLSFERICKGSKDAGPISKLDLAGRFRWLTATRSTVLQCSKVHPGLSEDPAETLENLYLTLVK